MENRYIAEKRKEEGKITPYNEQFCGTDPNRN